MKGLSETPLAASLSIALAVHVLLIFAIGFSLQDEKPPVRTMEITLASFPSDKEPDQADFLAQSNQQGSGSLDEKATPSSDMPAPFQDRTPKPVELQQQTAQLPDSLPKRLKQVTALSSKIKVAAGKKKKPRIKNKENKTPRPRIDLTREIASLEADFFKKRQAYAKRPIVHRINAASTKKSDVYYQEAWRRKVIRIGQINYPAQARRDRIYGELRVAVLIRRDGSLKGIDIIQSSGSDVLDKAAKKIVRMASPFTPFPPELQEYDVIEIIRTWRFEPGDLFRG